MIVLELLPEITAPGVLDERIGWAVPTDCHALSTLGHPVDVLQQRLNAGARACVLTGPEGVLAYVWFNGPQHEEANLGVRFHLAKGEMWLFDAMVKADRRGQGLYPTLLRDAAHELARQGVERILIAIDTGNHNSIRAHRAVGARPLGTVWSARLLGFTLVGDPHGLTIAWTGRSGHLDLATSRLA
jgi:hypothetical protein